MKTRTSLFALGGLLVGGLVLNQLLPRHRAAAGRMEDASLGAVENAIGRRLYAPTWLPGDMRPAADGTRIGAFRILTNYEEPDQERTLILAQEQRGPDRDRYHETRIIPTADLRAQVGPSTAYFMRGRSGERRLFWSTADSWLVLSSHSLTDDELLRVAQSVR